MRRRSAAAARPRSRRRTSFAASSSTASRQALADGAPITVACTQEAPLFREVAENFPQAQLTFVNIRETGGWSNDAAAAGPKAAALIAAAGEDMPPISLVTLESSGVALIYGRDEIAIEAAQRLADRLDITVLLTKARRRDPAPDATSFRCSRARSAMPADISAQFELAIDDYALPSPSSRAKLVFGPSRNGATSTCDLILDLSGGTPLFPAHELRPGYLRADPRDQRRRRARDCGCRRAGRHLRQAALRQFRGSRSARIRALPSPDARAVSICVRPARSRRTAMRSRSTPMSAPAAARAHRSARPARHPMRCRARTP